MFLLTLYRRRCDILCATAVAFFAGTFDSSNAKIALGLYEFIMRAGARRATDTTFTENCLFRIWTKQYKYYV
jgi:hypothetical protein